MKYFLKVLWAEAVKQHKNYFNNWMIYISLFVWPLFSFLAAYYSYSAFEVEETMISYINGKNILVFLMLGYMAMSFFRSVVQSAWNFSRERQSGTLEYIYLSTANRLAVLMGNALSSLCESSVVMLIFGMLIVLNNKDEINVNTIGLAVVLVIFIIMALLWGVFLNACFLYSRDTDFLFTILEEPMEIFAGVKVPVMIFPTWAKVISCIFPLTYILDALRQVTLNGAKLSAISGTIVGCLVIIMVLLTGILITIVVVEKHMRKTGNVVLF